MLCGKRFSSQKDADAFYVRLKNCQRLSYRPLSRQTRKTPQPIAVICGGARLFSFTGKPTRPGKSDRPSFHVKRRAEKSVHLPATFPPLATFIGTSTPKQNPSVKDLRAEKFVKRIYLSCMLCWRVCAVLLPLHRSRHWTHTHEPGLGMCMCTAGRYEK